MTFLFVSFVDAYGWRHISLTFKRERSHNYWQKYVTVNCILTNLITFILKTKQSKTKTAINTNITSLFILLQDVQPDNREANLATYNVKPGSTIHLMLLLYAVPSYLNEVVFDLYWGYPAHGEDYLDASALMFSGKNCAGVVDYRHRKRANGAIVHSGDLMDNFNQIGHHFITVELHNIPSRVTSIFFTLSAWDSPTISH